MKTNQIIQGDALEELKKLPSKSINMLMTSPPYWALRDYGSTVETIWNEVYGCEHDFEIVERQLHSGTIDLDKTVHWALKAGNLKTDWKTKDGFCNKCGAWKGQLGLEPTFDLYIKHLCDIFDEVKRVLRDDGTIWVNIGDTYASTPSGLSTEKAEEWEKKGDGLFNRLHRRHTADMTMETTPKPKSSLPPKCLTMIPFRFAIEMVNRGWILRNVIIWHKRNCMPSSIKDRFTVDFEYLFFFSKKKKYYFETQYEPHLTQESRPDGIVREREFGYDTKYPEVRGFKNKPNVKQPQTPQKHGQDINYGKQGRNKRTVWDIKDRTTPYAIIEPEFRKDIIEFRNLPEHDKIREYLTQWKNKRGITIEQIEKYFGNQAGHHWFEKDGSYPSKEDWIKLKGFLKFDDLFDEPMTEIFKKSGLKQNSIEGRNKRTVWTINPKPFKEAHFAVYPEELCETPIKSGCPEFVCVKCGKPREKIIEHKASVPQRVGGGANWHKNEYGRAGGFYDSENKVVGLTDCGCNVGFTSGIVLDPFFGAGTTGLVALKQNKKFIGIELNKEYIEIAKKRLKPFLEQTKL